MSEPRIELRERQPYLGIHAPSIDGIRQFADAAFPELFAWLGGNGVAPAGPPFIRYYEVGHAGEPLDSAGSYLTFTHVGPYRSDSLRDLADARAELLAWAEDNGVEYGQESQHGQTFPCAFEQYRIGPVEDADFTRWETEFAYLVLSAP